MPRRAAIRLVVAILAAAFFLTPLVLDAAGVGTRAFENRRLEPAPRLADGWRFFDVVTRYLIDRMPLRYQAVHANTWLDEHIFATAPVYGQNGLGGVRNDQALPFSGQPAQDRAALATNTTPTVPGKPAVAPPSTASQVVIGRNGWFFLEGVLQRACQPFMPFPAATREWEKLLAAIRASGRRAELIVAPDKSTIYPEDMVASTPDLACGRGGSDALWRQIDSRGARRAGIIGLRRPLLSAKRSSSLLLYYRTDSHWDSVGALAMTRTALFPLTRSVRVEPSEVVDTGKVRYSGDLLGLLGQSGSEIAPTIAIHRAPGAPVIAAPTLLLGDSYADPAVPELAPYIPKLTVLNWNEASGSQLADAIASARDVILETVEREFDYRATSVGFASPGFVALVKKTLAAHPLP